jgi:scyllo-inositol 2-dehydrogenase (NADP+)
VLLSVFHNRRWDWDFLTVKGLVAEGAIGSPTLFEVAVMRYKPPRGWRATTSAGGGLQYDWGAHLVDQAFQLVAGPLASVACDIQHRAWGADAGSYVRMLLRFESGVLYSIEIGNLAAIGKPRWYVLGEAGAISKWGLDPQEPALLKGDISKAAEPAMDHAKVVSMGPEGPVTRSIPSVRGDWTGYYENIRDAIAGHAPLAVTAEEARRVIATLEAATESARTGQPVIPTYR